MCALDWLNSRRQTGENTQKSTAWQPRPTVHVVVALVGLGHGIQSGEVEKKIVRGM